MEDCLRVPGQDPGGLEYQQNNIQSCNQRQGNHVGSSRNIPSDNASLRSAEKRLELLHDVVSIRSQNSRRPHSVFQPPKRTLWQKFKDATRAVIAFVFSNVGICVLVLGYLILGAFMFQHLEAPLEVKVSPVVGRRRDIVASLWNITERYNTLHMANWTSEVSAIIMQYEEEVIGAVGEGYDGQDIPTNLWTFSGALLYSITVITTIGYGHMVPVTPIGKIVTIVYAIVGVPLFLLYLSNIGEIFATSFKWSYSRLCKCQILKVQRLRRAQYRVDALPQQIHSARGIIDLQEREKTSVQSAERSLSNNSIEDDSSVCTNDEDEEDDEYSVADGGPKLEPLSRVSVPISLSLSVMITYVCGGAILFGEWEQWGFLDGSYFCFITLSTIGFGDMVPGDAASDIDDESFGGLVNLQFIFCSLYIIFGMAVIAMCFSLMQEKVVRGVVALGTKIGIIKPDPGG